MGKRYDVGNERAAICHVSVIWRWGWGLVALRSATVCIRSRKGEMYDDRIAGRPAAVPDCVLIDFHESEGGVPAARWGHTAAVIDDSLYICGGESDQTYGDLHIFRPGTGGNRS